MARRGVTCGAILRQNMKRKNNDLDRWRSSVRAPFEGVFSKFEKRARYRGHTKVQFQFFMDAIVHNVKRLVAIHAPPNRWMVPKIGIIFQKSSKSTKLTLLFDN